MPDGSTAVTIEAQTPGKRELVRIADCARRLIEPDLPSDIAALELDAAKKRIRRATVRGLIRKSGPLIDLSDFEAWKASQESRT